MNETKEEIEQVKAIREGKNPAVDKIPEKRTLFERFEMDPSKYRSWMNLTYGLGTRAVKIRGIK